jgi:hypothetical protein
VARRRTAKAVGLPIIRQASARRRPDRTDCQSIGAAVQQVDRFDGQRVRPTGILLHSVFPPALRRVGPRISQAEQAGSRENEPQGREWVKDPTGPREEQTVKVVRNGKGGTKRAWNPATRWSWKATPGSRLSGLGASEGRQNPLEDGRDERQVVVYRSGGADREADEVLEGERKTRSGNSSGRQRTDGCSAENAKVQAERSKGVGGAAKPNGWLRRAVRR